MCWSRNSLFNRCTLLIMLLFGFHGVSAQLYINEIAAKNASAVFDPDFGEFSDYIELFNAGKQAIKLGNYQLTDNPLKRDKWIFPDTVIQAGGFLLLWADNRNKLVGDTAYCVYRDATVKTSMLHTSFALSGDGEYLGLFDRDGNKVDDLYFGVQENDVFYGRNPENNHEWLYFGDATPGITNPDVGASKPVHSGKTTFSTNGGFYPGPVELSFSVPAQGAQIRFTTDGSTPGHASTHYSERLLIQKSTTVKARVYENGKLPGPVVTHTFFINENIQLPVINISSNHEHFQDYDFGLIRNAIKDREVPAVVEYFDGYQQPGFVQNAGIRLFGSTIYRLPQRPLSIRFKAKYGEPELVYPLFGGRKSNRYSAFLLRNGGNDYNLAFFRDGLAMSLAKNKMDLDLQDYQPCVVFFNGDYQGIYEIRDRLDENYLANWHQLNSESIDLLEDSLQIVAGKPFSYRELISYVETNDLSKEEHFAYIQKNIDLNEFTNYLIHKIFIGYQLFDLNNRYWRPQNEDGKWRWIAADMEHAFGQLGGDQYYENTLAKVAGTEGNLPEWSTLLFRRLLENRSFRDEFAQRSAAYLNNIYSPEKTLAVVDSLQNLLESQMPRHIFKWKTPVNLNVWKGNIQFIREFLQQRPKYYRAHIAQQFGLSDSVLVSLRIEGKGKVAMAGVWNQHDSSSGYYFKDAHLTLTAVPEHGYRFVGWDDQVLNSTSIVLQNDTLLVARFVPQSINIIPEIISSNLYLTNESGPWYALNDVNVLQGATLSIEAGTTLLMSDGVSFYIHGGLQIMGEANNPVNILPDPSPAARKPFYNTRPRWGVIALLNASETIEIRQTKISGSGYGKNRNMHFSAISSYNSQVKLTGTTITDCFQPFYAEFGSVQISQCNFKSLNTCDLINVKYSTGAIVEHCILNGNNAPDTDAIDYDGVIDGIISGNKITGFRGDNSDGIDVGEASINLLIENNEISNCTDKAISVGQASSIIARRNLITHCNLGIAVKDSFSIATIDQNTFHGNTHAVACYEKNSGKGGGQAIIKNSILSGSLNNSVWADALSSIAISYSLSDTDTLFGLWNLHADPQFISVSTGNYDLKPGSPCIDAGDPFSPKDSDQSRADMGAYYAHSGLQTQKVRINEINYHAAYNYNTGDWVELYNYGKTPVDLGGWTLNCADKTFRFKSNTKLEQGAYVVLANNPDSFLSYLPHVTTLVNDAGISLDNKAAYVTLRDASNTLVHSVIYKDIWPWPPLADGLGATLELEHLTDGTDPTNWRESYVLMGTPGAENSKGQAPGNIKINELMASNNSFPDTFGETDDWFELYNSNDYPVNAGGWYLTDKFSAPNKWQIPLNYPELTTIAPGGFLLLWADDQPEQGPLHTNFKLSASGEELALYQRFHLGYSDIDRITFGPQSASQSFGRYADGADALMLLKPTPGASNVRTGNEVIKQNVVSVAPNPFDQFTRFDTRQVEKPFDLYIRNATGALVWKLDNSSNDAVIFERGSLKNGVYLYHIESINHKPVTGKIMIY